MRLFHEKQARIFPASVYEFEAFYVGQTLMSATSYLVLDKVALSDGSNEDVFDPHFVFSSERDVEIDAVSKIHELDLHRLDAHFHHAPTFGKQVTDEV